MTGPDNVKVFPLESTSTGQVNVVIINKNEFAAVGVLLNASGDWGDASVTRLVAAGPRPLSARNQITLGGMGYMPSGSAMRGNTAMERVSVQRGSNGVSSYRVYMPPGSAAVVRLAAPSQRKAG